MQLSPDAKFQRRDLRKLTKAYPDDRRLKSLVGLMREQIEQYEEAPRDGLIPVAERTMNALHDHMHERGIVWPPERQCAHRRVIGASWYEGEKYYTRIRCKDCGATLKAGKGD